MSIDTVTRTFVSQRVEWERWHAAREAELAADHGWLSLTGLAWLTFHPTEIPGLPGQWWSDGERALLGAVRADGLEVDGAPVDGIVAASVGEGESRTWLTRGTEVVELLRRDGRLGVRTRDSAAPTLRDFRGVPTYPYAAAWTLTGRYRPFEQSRTIQVETSQPDLRNQFRAAGVLAVELEPSGDIVELLVARNADGTLRLPFHDPTNGAATARWRTVTTSVPDPDGQVEVDLNRAVNLPFAFSGYGTCPAPPPGNFIPLPVTAGERLPR